MMFVYLENNDISIQRFGGFSPNLHTVNEGMWAQKKNKYKQALYQDATAFKSMYIPANVSV